MSIGSITSTGKQNATVAGALKYKKIQKGNDSFCFLADDSVVDFTSLVNFILNNGGVGFFTASYGAQKRISSIPCSRGYYDDNHTSIFASLYVYQQRSSAAQEWPTPTEIKAVGFMDSSSPYTTSTINNTWTVV